MATRTKDLQPQFRIKFEPGVKQVIEEAAARENRTMTNFIETAVHNELIQKGFKNKLSATRPHQVSTRK